MKAGCRLLLAAIAFLAPLPPVVAAGQADPHALFEQRCAGCHADHASSLVDGIRRTPAEVEMLLRDGHGRLADDEIELILAQLEAIRAAGGLYRERCRICHDRGVDLARKMLTLRDGRLLGRYSGRDIEAFLTFHGRLDAAGRATIRDMLERQLGAAQPRSK